MVASLYANLVEHTVRLLRKAEGGGGSLDVLHDTAASSAVRPQEYTVLSHLGRDFDSESVIGSSRVSLELTYTAWNLKPFAEDCGDDGAPFIWESGASLSAPV